MTASEWVWTLRVFDHVDLHASDYAASVRFYETVLSPLGIPKIEEHEQGTWSSAWTDFTNLNVKCGAALTAGVMVDSFMDSSFLHLPST